MMGETITLLSAKEPAVRSAIRRNTRRRFRFARVTGELAQRLGGTILTADHHEFDVLAEQSLYGIKFIR